MQPANRPERLRQAQIAILDVLLEAFLRRTFRDDDPSLEQIRERAGREPADEEPLDGSAVVEDALRVMVQAQHIKQRRVGRHHELEITAEGIEWLAKESPGITYGQMERLGFVLRRQIATMARMRGDLQLKQDALDRRVSTLDRDFFGRVVPFFALFVAAFALIDASVQVTTRAFASAPAGTDPGTVFVVTAAQAGGVLLPVALVILVLLLGAWVLSRLLPH